MLILAPLASIPCLRYTTFRFFLPLSCFYPLPYLTLYFAILLNFIVRILCSLSRWILCSLSINTKILLFDILVFYVLLLFFSSFKPSVIFARSVFISPACSNSALYPSSMSLTFVYPYFFKNASIYSATPLGILVPHTTFLAFLSFLCFSSYLLSLSLLGFIPKPSVNTSSYQYDDYILPISAFRVKLFYVNGE